MYLFDFWPLLYIKVVFQTKPNLIKAKWQSQKGDQHLITTSTALCSYPDGVRVGVGDVAHPSMGGPQQTLAGQTDRQTGRNTCKLKPTCNKRKVRRSCQSFSLITHNVLAA